MVKAIFCDFYGTVVLEDDEPIGEITQKVFVSSNYVFTELRRLALLQVRKRARISRDQRCFSWRYTNSVTYPEK